MNKSMVAVIVILVIVVAGGGAFLAMHKNYSNNSASNTPTTANGSSSNTIAVATNMVEIQNFAFSPPNITVKKGTTVTWTNNDSTGHTVTETDGQNGPKSDILAPGKTFVFTFDTAGSYKYHCSIHTDMTGTVTVTN